MSNPPKQTKPKVPELVKSALKEKSDEVIENTLKPKHIKTPPTDNDFNYLVDIYTKWYRNYARKKIGLQFNPHGLIRRCYSTF